MIEFLRPTYARGKRVMADAMRSYIRAAFSNRDIRRTWKTLAGHAGLTKEERDLIQNHKKPDVSSRHYDRYDYLSEKREAMAKWETWFRKNINR